ncbi:MAG: GldM family protein [Bacteroidia bacterium]
MKIRKLNFILSFLAIALFCSFTLPEPQQDKSTLNLSEFSGSNNRISRGKLKVYKKVQAGFGEDFAFDGLKLKVTSYVFAHVPKNGLAYVENVNGNQITPNIRQHLLQAKPGDMIILSQVTVKGNGWDFNRTINGPVLTVY